MRSVRATPLLLLVQAIGLVIRATPRPIRALSLFVVSGLVTLICRRDAAVARLQLNTFLPDATHITPRRVFAQACSLLAKSVAQFSGQPLPPVHVTAESLAMLDRLKNSGRPVLALTGHIGDWELLSRWLGKHYPLSVLGRAARIKMVHTVLEAFRGEMPMIWRGTREGATHLKQVFTQNRWLGLLLDQDLVGSEIMVPFFGVPAGGTDRLLDQFKRMNALFVMGFIVKKKNGEYHFLTREITSTNSTEEIIREFNVQLEEIIREYPEQWMWFHKRWRTQYGVRQSHEAYLQFLRDLRPLGQPRWL